MQTQKKNRSGSHAKRDANWLSPHVRKGFTKEVLKLVATWPGNSFERTYLRAEFASKFLDDSKVSPLERRDAAIEKWLRVEQQNSKTNLRMLLAELDVGCPDFCWTAEHKLVRYVKDEIKSILGPCPDNAFSNGAVTNGASTRVKRSPWAAIEKCEQIVHITQDMAPYYLQYATNTPLPKELEIVESSVMFTVPKNSDIDRVACKEPEGNMLFQRSLGNLIRARLRRRGIDLNDQSRNRELARTAVNRGLATIDLSSASDTVCHRLVMRILPDDWFQLLDSCRTHRVTLPSGEEHSFEMFSTMGNGFTFELESLIFYAIAKATARASGISGTISVYGDDIIIPSKLARRFKRVMDWFGFKLNAKKSYWSSPFRESCGGHYFGGQDVTPVYCRGLIEGKIDMINLLNRLAEWDTREHSLPWVLSDHFRPFWDKWSKQVPASLYGGWDFADPTRLVTGHNPRKRLVLDQKVLRDTQKKRVLRTIPNKLDERAEYALWWLRKAGSNRVTSIDVSSGTRYRLGNVNRNFEPTGPFTGPLALA